MIGPLTRKRITGLLLAAAIGLGLARGNRGRASRGRPTWARIA